MRRPIEAPTSEFARRLTYVWDRAPSTATLLLALAEAHIYAGDDEGGAMIAAFAGKFWTYEDYETMTEEKNGPDTEPKTPQMLEDERVHPIEAARTLMAQAIGRLDAMGEADIELLRRWKAVRARLRPPGVGVVYLADVVRALGYPEGTRRIAGPIAFGTNNTVIYGEHVTVDSTAPALIVGGKDFACEIRGSIQGAHARDIHSEHARVGFLQVSAPGGDDVEKGEPAC